MKCPSCKEGELKLTTYYPKTKKNMYYVREKAILSCNLCEHKERFT